MCSILVTKILEKENRVFKALFQKKAKFSKKNFVIKIDRK